MGAMKCPICNLNEVRERSNGQYLCMCCGHKWSVPTPKKIEKTYSTISSNNFNQSLQEVNKSINDMNNASDAYVEALRAKRKAMERQRKAQRELQEYQKQKEKEAKNAEGKSKGCGTLIVIEIVCALLGGWILGDIGLVAGLVVGFLIYSKK